MENIIRFTSFDEVVKTGGEPRGINARGSWYYNLKIIMFMNDKCAILS